MKKKYLVSESPTMETATFLATELNYLRTHMFIPSNIQVRITDFTCHEVKSEKMKEPEYHCYVEMDLTGLSQTQELQIASFWIGYMAGRDSIIYKKRELVTKP